MEVNIILNILIFCIVLSLLIMLFMFGLPRSNSSPVKSKIVNNKNHLNKLFDTSLEVILYVLVLYGIKSESAYVFIVLIFTTFVSLHRLKNE